MAQLQILHDFTRDAAPLVRAFQRFGGRQSAALEASQPEPANTGDAEFDELLDTLNSRIANYYIERRALTTLSALEAVANHLVAVPGRKNLIWVSGSFPFSFGFEAMSGRFSLSNESKTFSAELERAARAVNNANVAIYPVDARGLVGAFPNPNFNAPRSARGLAQLSPSEQNAALAAVRSTHDTMQLLAERTGGRAFYNTNDIQGSIRHAVADSEVTYELGFYPTHGKWDSRFHEIKVRVNRPGLEVRHRKGYLALPEAAFDERQQLALLRQAMTSPLNATALGLTVGIARPSGDPPALRLGIHVAPRGVTLAQEGERWVGALNFFFVQQDLQAQKLASEGQTLTMRLTEERRRQFTQDGLVLERKIPLAAGASRLRVIVRDAGSGAIGSVTIPLEDRNSKRGPEAAAPKPE